MNFEKKNLAEIAKMSDEEKEKYFADKEAFEKSQREEELKSLKSGLENVIATNQKETQQSVDNVLRIVEEIKATQGGLTEEALIEVIKRNHEAIKKAYESKSGVVEIEFKQAAPITTGAVTLGTAPNILGTQIAPVSNVNLRGMDIENFVSVLPTSQPVYAYTEVVPKDGNYEFVAEGNKKPQIDFKVSTEFAKPKKIAAWMHLTEESVYDIKGLEGVAKDYLKKKHDLFKNKAILFGDGAGENPKGATKYGRAFVAGSMALKVVKPNFMDVVNAAVTDIATTHNYEDETPYMANLVLVNPSDFYLELVAAKDNEGRPLYPTASLFNTVVIGGMVIKSDESIPQGKIFVGDLSKYNITDYLSYTVRIGWINDDFIKNQFVILGESRFHAFVKKLDEKAFIYDDIATIKTAITKA